MSETERHNNRLRQQAKVVVPGKMLNPFLFSHFSANYWRKGRILAYLAPFVINPDFREPHMRLVASAVGTAMTNPFFASKVKDAYKDIDFSQPVLLPAFEKNFPEGWISAKRIRETHPIYYIDLKGNLVFLKPTRAEYYRYLFQKSLLGKLGYNTWWLRGYLEPPKAPESVKKWANEKLARLMERMKPQLGRAPKPALVRVRSNARTRQTSLRRRAR